MTGLRRRTWPQGRTGSMLGQVRLLYLAFCMIWSVIGLSGFRVPDRTSWVVAALALLVVEASLLRGYRRGRFSWRTWIVEAPCVGVVAAASGFGITVGLLFLWINFRALYGNLRDQLFGAGSVILILGAGVGLAGAPPADTTSLAVMALMGMAVTYTLARGIRARDRASARESVVASAGVAFAAVTDRGEAAQAAAAAAARLDESIGGAVVTTIAAGSIRLIGLAGAVVPDALGRSMSFDDLGPEARGALQPGGFALITDGAAAPFAALAGVPAQSRLMLTPMAVHGKVFGLLIATFHRRPVDDLTAALSTLAEETALTLDQLLSQSRLRVVVENSPDALILAGEQGRIRYANPASERLLGCASGDLVGGELKDLLHPDELDAALAPGSPGPLTCRMRGHADQPWTEFEVLVEYVIEHDGSRSLILNARDISERQRLEVELRHAQKLESVGRLASGVAHEINTPIQFVGDNVRFLEESFTELLTLVTTVRERFGDSDAQISELLGDIDVDFLLEEIPAAARQTLEGVERVATIVRAMKAFGHPGTEEKTLADINEMIANTLVVAAGEIKYVADVETELEELPLVRCHVGDINQTLLNLVVNAAHAIDSAARGRGTIRVMTRPDGDEVVIEVADTGTGVPPEIAGKLFDPFFTTKEVGRGTGQGLPLARSLVVDRHHGSIAFRTEVGAGTVFTVRLPVGQDEPAPQTSHLEVAAA